MTTDDRVRDEKGQYKINGEREEISALSSGKINKDEYVPGEKTLPTDQSRMTEQVKITCRAWKTT